MESVSREKVLHCLSGEYYGGKVTLHCPVCDYEYTCVQDVYYRKGDLVIALECECQQHSWNIVIEHHKGIDIVSIEIVDSIGKYDEQNRIIEHR
jgi:hypothetical protein